MEVPEFVFYVAQIARQFGLNMPGFVFCVAQIARRFGVEKPGFVLHKLHGSLVWICLGLCFVLHKLQSGFIPTSDLNLPV